ncbi:MAG: hypothetical protein U1E08_02365 [Coriobacteriia bacterium]|nr:hypothetical protein [Actinomycetota bacterium]MDZ4166526.1 hypothetical protein [Coriobacteriia bacterium]
MNGEKGIDAFGSPVEGSVVRYTAGWGAQKVTVTDSALVFEFRDAAGVLVDSYRMPAPQ